MTTMTDFKPGDLVTIDHPRARGQVFKVVAKLQKNYRVILTDVDGGDIEGARSSIASPELLHFYLKGEPAPLGVPYREVPIPAYFPLGATVSVRGRDGIYVVLKPTPKGYSVALLGGDNDRYLNCPHQLLTAITVKAEVTE